MSAEPPDATESSERTAAGPSVRDPDPDPLPPPTRGKIAVLVFVVLTAAFLGVVTYGMRTVRQRLPGPVDAPALASDPAPAPAPRGHCKGLKQSSAAACDGEQIAWCDAAGQRVACCAPGLAAGPEPGVCMCPLGAPLDPAAKAQGCDPPSRSAADKTSLLRTMHAARSAFTACSPAPAGLADAGPVEVTLQLTIAPEGQVFSAEVTSATVADARLSECVAAAARRLRFDPPYGGYLELEYPLDLTRK